MKKKMINVRIGGKPLAVENILQGGDHENSKLEEADLSKLDFPHIVLEPYETRLLSDSPFCLHTNVFIMTDNSKRDARRIIAEENRIDGRCSHLYEACDMRHVERQRETIRNIERKLGL